MDVASLALSLISLQAGNTQQIATSVLKSNIDAERSSVLTILGAGNQPSLANVGAGIGGNLNIAA